MKPADFEFLRKLVVELKVNQPIERAMLNLLIDRCEELEAKLGK